MAKPTVASTNDRIDSLEDQISDVFENFERRITDLEENTKELADHIETMQRVVANLDEETKTAIWLNAENLHKAKDYMKSTRNMAKKALAQQSNGSRAPQQQPKRTVNAPQGQIEITTVPAGTKGALKCNACGELHPEVAQVRACYQRKYANA